jgi:hypothetical protein
MKTQAEDVFKTVAWGGVDVFFSGPKQVCSVLKTSSPRHSCSSSASLAYLKLIIQGSLQLQKNELFRSSQCCFTNLFQPVNAFASICRHPD